MEVVLAILGVVVFVAAWWRWPELNGDDQPLKPEGSMSETWQKEHIYRSGSKGWPE